jgi:hypothetical protein
MIGASSIFRLRSDVRYRIIDGEAVVVRQEEAEVIVLNSVGARVLELVRGGAPACRGFEALTKEYRVEPVELERDVLSFLGELVEAGVIEEIGGGGRTVADVA